MKVALEGQPRIDRMVENMVRFTVPRLKPKSVAIVGFSPSLVDTWEDVTKCDAVLTMSGSHDFLLSRGIVPTYHVECDPRPHKANFLRRTHPDTTYLLASTCHPSLFEMLSHRKVVMWHGFTDDGVEEQEKIVGRFDPGVRLLAGGTQCGGRSIVVARELGHTVFNCHGMDCSYRGEIQWAGEHYTQRHDTFMLDVDGKQFETSDLMLQATEDFFVVMKMLSGCQFKVYGDGLLAERMKMLDRDPRRAMSKNWHEPRLQWHEQMFRNPLPVLWKWNGSISQA